MAFDFGSSASNNESSDPTSDFVSKFPDLDADDADAALTAVTANNNAGATGSGSGGFGSGGWGDEDDNDVDLLGGGRSTSINAASQKPRDEREEFESTFPELEDVAEDGDHAAIQAQKTAYAPSSNSNGFMAQLAPSGAAGASSTTQVSGRGPTPSALEASSNSRYNSNHYDHEEEEEPEPLREWRHKQGDLIARRDAEGERKKAEAISQAERDIDEFYREYTAKKEKSIKRNKELEAEFTEKRNKELAEGTTWDRITKLVELQNSQSKTIAPGGAGSTDLSRFRELLLSLRREGETAPAAGGY